MKSLRNFRTPPEFWPLLSGEAGWFARMVGIAAALLLVAMLSGSLLIGGHFGAFDEYLLRAFRVPGDPSDPIGPRFVEVAVRDVTALGGVLPMAMLVVLVSTYLYLQDHRRTALALVVSALTGVLVSELLKSIVGRSRPVVVPHLVPEVSGSFPSGHAMMSAVIYMTLGHMLARLEPRRAVRRFVLAVSVALPVAIGMSRIYLGVHWPTDVAAGWIFGAFWVAATTHVFDRILSGQPVFSAKAPAARSPRDD